MDFSIFKKAVHHKVQIEGFGNDRMFVLVGKYPIEVRQEASGVQLLCRCKHCSILAVNNSFCSYQAALIHFLVEQKKKGDKK